MKPVDTQLAAVERLIERLELIEKTSQLRREQSDKVGNFHAAYYWQGYNNCAGDIRRDLLFDAQWLRDHSL